MLFPTSNRPASPLSPTMKRAKQDFLAKWPNLSPLACVICGSSQFAAVTDRDRYGFDYPTGRCRSCGNVQQSAYYSPEALDDFYSRYYRLIYPPFNVARYFEAQRNRGREILDFAPEISGDVLEIGCGAGGILSVLKESGCNVVGMDSDDEYLAFGQSKGLDLRKTKPTEKFDYIVIAHVLEHITTPKDFLADAALYLKPGGKIYVEVPSLESVLASSNADIDTYFQNAHVVHFMAPTFRNLMAMSGFEVLKMDEHIRCLIAPGEPAQPTFDPQYSRDLLNAIAKKRAANRPNLIRSEFSRFWEATAEHRRNTRKAIEKLVGR